MTTERCPTCGQPLPAGLSRDTLEDKLKADRDRETRAVLDRERRRMEAQLMAKLVPKAKAEAKKELRAETEEALERERHERERAMALERKRRQKAEQTTDQLKRQVKKLETQLSSASPQDRGTVAQEDVARAIDAACRGDSVLPVRGGQRGGDIIQDVCDRGQPCGRLLWEVKDGSDWSENWIIKAKDDARRVDADYVILATSAFPAKTRILVVRQGVIVVAPELVGTLAGLLHGVVVSVAGARAAGTERAAKVAKILDYVASTECRGRFEAIKDAVGELRMMQTNERSYHDKHWGKEERLFIQIAAAGTNIKEQLESIARETPVKLAASG